MAWPLGGRPKVVEVEWVDSSWLHGWQDATAARESIGRTALPSRSVGYLWGRNKHKLTLVQSHSSVGQVAECFDIPAGAVRRVRVLRAAAASVSRKRKKG